MNVNGILLVIIVILIFSLWYISDNRVRGGYTSWDTDKTTRELINNIINVMNDSIKLRNYDYDVMRNTVLSISKNLKNKHIIAVNKLFDEFKEQKIERWDTRLIKGIDAFEFIFAGIVEAYIHLYLIEGIELRFEYEKMMCGSFNVILFCHVYKNQQFIGKRILRIRALDINNETSSFQIVHDTKIDEMEIHGITINQTKGEIPIAIRNLQYIYKLFAGSNAIVQPICSSYFLYHDFNNTIAVEWSLNECLYSEPPYQSHDDICKFAECMQEVHRITANTGYNYFDWKKENVFYDNVNDCYSIIDVDFIRDDTPIGEILCSIRVPPEVRTSHRNIANYIILRYLWMCIKKLNAVGDDKTNVMDFAKKDYDDEFKEYLKNKLDIDNIGKITDEKVQNYLSTIIYSE